MKKGLKITENNYLNMDNIVEWWIGGDGSLDLFTGSADCQPVTIISDSMEYNDRHRQSAC